MGRFGGAIKGIAILVAIFILIQFIPYGKAHTSPPSGQEPKWDSPQTRVLAQRACFDCHSGETVWPWYSNIAPISWLIQRDVDEGRQEMNFTDWVTTSSSGRIHSRRANEVTEVILHNTMPPFYYSIMHPDAGLTNVEKDLLIQGLNKTLDGK